MNPVLSSKNNISKKRNPILIFVAALAIYSMIIPIIILDLWTYLYQEIFFAIEEIPKIKQSDYVKIDRWDLKRLNMLQKINCVYCEYVNGITSWAKAVAHQTEIYSCAVKHRHLVRGNQDGNDYYKFSDFK